MSPKKIFHMMAYEWNQQFSINCSKSQSHDGPNYNFKKSLYKIWILYGRSHFLHLEKSYHFLHLDFWPFSPPRPYYLTKYQNLHFGAFLRKYRFLHLFLEKIPNSPHVSILDDKYSQRHIYIGKTLNSISYKFNLYAYHGIRLCITVCV